MSAGVVLRSSRYQWTLTALLSVNFGFVLFDRNALSFLMPFVQPELRLSNTQVGLLSSGLSLSWALAAFAVGGIAGRLGTRRQWLVASTLLFSVCSFGSGLATGFAAMFATRLLMGLAEGGIMPLSQALIANQVDARRRGLAMGIAQGFGSSLMGSFVAPVVLVAFAESVGWRHAFFLAGAPGLLLALLLAVLVKDDRGAVPAAAPTAEVTAAARPLLADLCAVLADANVRRCLVISIAFVGYLVMTWSFLPLYLTKVRGFTPGEMSWLMGTLGVGATLFSFLIPGLSDRIGRRLPLRVVPVLAFLLPLAALYFDGPVLLLAAVFFVGWTFTGIMPLFMATVPAESVAARHVGLALGLCMGGSEVLGGVIAPLLGGLAADRHGLQAPVWGLVFLAGLATIAAWGVRETAPLRAVKISPS